MSADPGDAAGTIDSAAARLAERLLGMRANREVIPEDPNHSVRWHEHDYPSPVARWNYHPEYELHLTRKGTGKFIVGDHIGTFEAGHVVAQRGDHRTQARGRFHVPGPGVMREARCVGEDRQHSRGRASWRRTIALPRAHAF